MARVRIKRTLLVILAMFWCSTCTIGQLQDKREENADELAANVTELIRSLFDGYDKILRPNYGGRPVIVNISMAVSSLGPIVETTMDYTLDFYFRQIWIDNRLSFDWADDLYLNSEVLSKLWLPDTYFVNEKKSYFHTITTHNSLIRISPSGKVLYSTRLTIVASCPMNLQYFPFDQQRCSLILESYAYNTRDIDYTWVKDSPITIMDDIELPQFSILGKNYRVHHQVYLVGNYTQLIADFYFVRNLSYYVIQIYFPSILIVILSWVSFFVNRGATPARVALGITTVLTMATIMATTASSLPKISYIKAIDVFLGMCFLYVFASLVEYATVSYFNKARYKEERERRRKEKQRSIDIEMNSAAMIDHQGNVRSELYKVPDSTDIDVSPTSFKNANEVAFTTLGSEESDECEIQFRCVQASPSTLVRQVDARAEQARMKSETSLSQGSGVWNRIRRKLKSMKAIGLNASKIDIYSRIIFPASFIILNTVYWSYYLSVTDYTLEELLARDSKK
ncbi:gamma-aminobutyric acid receptor subunit beta-like [Glandiceps talaboti]